MAEGLLPKLAAEHLLSQAYGLAAGGTPGHRHRPEYLDGGAVWIAVLLGPRGAPGAQTLAVIPAGKFPGGRGVPGLCRGGRVAAESLRHSCQYRPVCGSSPGDPPRANGVLRAKNTSARGCGPSYTYVALHRCHGRHSLGPLPARSESPNDERQTYEHPVVPRA